MPVATCSRFGKYLKENPYQRICGGGIVVVEIEEAEVLLPLLQETYRLRKEASYPLDFHEPAFLPLSSKEAFQTAILALEETSSSFQELKKLHPDKRLKQGWSLLDGSVQSYLWRRTSPVRCLAQPMLLCVLETQVSERYPDPHVNLPGGKPDLRITAEGEFEIESAWDCAVRETAEESGLLLPPFFPLKRREKPVQSRSMYFYPLEISGQTFGKATLEGVCPVFSRDEAEDATSAVAAPSVS